MRDVYYQSVGNPVQFDRLPVTRPAIELLGPSTANATRAATIAAMFTLASGTALFVLIAWRPPGWSWLEPFDLAIALPVLTVACFHVAITRNASVLMHPLSLAAVALIALNHRTPGSVQVLLSAAAIGTLTYGLGLHGAFVFTTVPMPRSTAYALRTRWRRQLFFLSVVAAALTAAAFWSGARLFQLAIFALPLAALLARAPARPPTARWKLLGEICVSWLTYQPPALPGLSQSPLGNVRHRTALTLLTVLLATTALIRMPHSPLLRVAELGLGHHEAVVHSLDQHEAGHFERMRFGGFSWALSILSVLLLPVLLPWLLATSLASPVLLEAGGCRDEFRGANPMQAVLADMRRSPDLTERGSVYLGRVVSDGSPVQVPRKVFAEHAHGLGDSGGGKTSLFLCPLIEQLGMSGECSIIVIDNKADTLELLASLQAVAEHVRREYGYEAPLKVFSNQADKDSFAFNPMTQPFWGNFDLLTRTDIICGANGLTYGNDYGQGYYSSANAANLYHALKTFPHVTTFSELAECIQEVLVSASKRELHPEIRKAGVHVMEVMKRLAACDPLNVDPAAERDPLVVKHAIDFTKVFAEPQLHYFHLSATLSPSGAPEIARLVTYMLLAAATQTERRVPVFLVIDEFQRMVASNLEYMLQLARSMGVGVILANQSMEDLKHSTTNLIPAIEANCRLRQWFSVSSTDDQQRLIHGSGLTVDYALGRSITDSSGGRRTVSRSLTETVVSRITINDVALTNDHRFRSFLHLKRGAGYAQYGGMPVIIESGYHISKVEYDRRRSLPWPRLPGAFVPNERRAVDAERGRVKPPEPGWTEDEIEEINGSSAPVNAADSAVIHEMFTEFQRTIPSVQPRRREQA